MNRGFIQIPILIAIFVGVAVLGGTGYVAYKSGQKSSVQTEDSVSEQATSTSSDEIVDNPVISETKEKDVIKKEQPKNSTVVETSSTVAIPPEWINPAGGFYTPEEVAKNLACKIETALSKLPPTNIDPAGMRSFFEYVVTSNPPISNLNSLKSLLLKVRNDYVFSDSDSSGYGGIAYTPEQLNAMDAAQQQIGAAYVNYLNYWISVTDKIIRDKEDNGCIDKALDYFL